MLFLSHSFKKRMKNPIRKDPLRNPRINVDLLEASETQFLWILLSSKLQLNILEILNLALNPHYCFD